LTMMTPPLLVIAVMTDLQAILRLKISVMLRKKLTAAETIGRNALVHATFTIAFEYLFIDCNDLNPFHLRKSLFRFIVTIIEVL